MAHSPFAMSRRSGRGLVGGIFSRAKRGAHFLNPVQCIKQPLKPTRTGFTYATKLITVKHQGVALAECLTLELDARNSTRHSGRQLR